MTCNTSEVAVCCSSASRVSVISRVFSIAITAWAAKFCTSSICLSVKGRPLAVELNYADRGPSLRKRHTKNGPRPPSRPTARARSACDRRVGRDIGDLDDLAFEQASAL